MMLMPTKSLFTYITLSVTLLLSACNGQNSSQKKVAELTITSTSVANFNDDQLAHLPFDTSAHWLTPNVLLLPKNDAINEHAGEHYQLLSKVKNQLRTASLTAIAFPKTLASKFPHLANFQAYEVNIKPTQAKKWLKQPLMVVKLSEHNQPEKVSYVQTGAVIDALYTQTEHDADEVSDLGATISEQGVTFKLWAPTAQQVVLLVFNDDLTPHPKTPRIAMVENPQTGVWSVQGDSSLAGAYYQYQVTVFHPQTKKVEIVTTTDPYSLSLSVNSKYSQVVNLNDSNTQPKNWLNQSIPTVSHVEDLVLYETHIRDFSADEKALSHPQYRGKYKAFTEQNSDGIKHLKALKKAGLNTIHLLPTFDIGTVNELTENAVDINNTIATVKLKVCAIKPQISLCSADLNGSQTLKSLLESFDFNTDEAQKIVSELRGFDNYNWGYDPYHYTVPEGSYAINPNGKSRLIEFREMVQSLHHLGFRVIMDVVYNHTLASRLENKSVLDKIVPNYYHRLDPVSGEIAQSTCCDNTATERVMMAKLMTDSLVVWARDYKIDGFRFDLMGHQPKAAMIAAREAVRKVDPDTYFYGEGWNFGEVANNRRFEQASQLNLGGTEIGTYSDRLRDAVRGGGNNTRDSQGLGNGLFIQPNERHTKQESRAEYDLRMDQLRVGLAGNLRQYQLINAQGKQVTGEQIPYGDQPTGYALDPADTINYVSKHDNQTLWDNSQYRLPFNVSTDNRIRMHLQSLSFVLFAQGIPFLHMGSEFMRSKSFLRDSYDYGDWFNRVDFSKQTNHYDIGLPPAEKDQANWPLIKKVLQGHEGRDHVNAAQISQSSKIFTDMLSIRMSSPLFRLTSVEAIMQKVSFLNTGKAQQTGLVVMKIDDSIGQGVDEKISSLIVIFNLNTREQKFAYKGAQQYQLHPIQQQGNDDAVKQSRVDNKGFTVPALSSVVFIKP